MNMFFKNKSGTRLRKWYQTAIFSVQLRLWVAAFFMPVEQMAVLVAAPGGKKF